MTCYWCNSACRATRRGHRPYHLRGSRDRLVGVALGKPVKCVGTTIDQARSALKGMGMQLARSEKTLGQNLVRLYKALGGGWKNGTHSGVAASLNAAGPNTN